MLDTENIMDAKTDNGAGTDSGAIADAGIQSDTVLNTDTAALADLPVIPSRRLYPRREDPSLLVGHLLYLQGATLQASGALINNAALFISDTKFLVELVVKGALVDIFRGLKIKPGKLTFTFTGTPTIGLGQIQFNTTVTTNVKACPTKKTSMQLQTQLQKVIARFVKAFGFDASYKVKNNVTVTCNPQTNKLTIKINVNYD